MVTICQDSSKSCQWLVLARSNVSISLEHLLLIISALTLFSLAMAVWLATQGFWPILIFSSIQMAVVAWALYVAWRRNWVQESIEITAEKLTLSHKSLQQTWQAEFQSAWVKVQLIPHPRDWYPPQLLLSAMGKTVELGRFLNRSEKRELASYLQTALAECSAWSHPDIKTIS